MATGCTPRRSRTERPPITLQFENGSDDAQRRRYNSFWGRFDQTDPSGRSYDLTNPQSINRYAYVGGDTVNRVDPTRLFSDATGGCSALNGFAGCSGGDSGGFSSFGFSNFAGITYLDGLPFIGFFDAGTIYASLLQEFL